MSGVYGTDVRIGRKNEKYAENRRAVTMAKLVAMLPLRLIVEAAEKEHHQFQ